MADWWIRAVNLTNSTSGDTKMLNLIATTLWNIWKARNLKVFEGKDSSPHEIVTISLKLVEEFEAANTILSLPP